MRARILYASTRQQGIYKSTNSGASFAQIGVGTLPNLMGRIAVDPNNASRIAAAPCPNDPSAPIPKMLVGTDAGSSFTAATVATSIPAPTTFCVTTVTFSPNTSGLVILRGVIASLTQGNFSAVVRSTDSGADYTAVTGGSGARGFSFPAAGQVFAANFSGAALTSSDSGASFTTLASSPVLPGLTAVESLATGVKPGTNAVRYLASGDGLYVISDGGSSWTKRTSGVRATKIRALALNPLPNVNTIFAGHGENATVGQGLPLYRSLDNGLTWNGVNGTGQVETIRTLLLDENTASSANSVLYLAGRDLFPQTRPVGQRESPIAKSVDGGLTWNLLRNFAGLGAPPSNASPYLVIFLDTQAIVPDRSVINSGTWTKLYLAAEGFLDRSRIGGPVTLIIPRIRRTLNAGANWNTIATPGGAVGSPGMDGLPTGACISDGSLPTPFPTVDAPLPYPSQSIRSCRTHSIPAPL